MALTGPREAAQTSLDEVMKLKLNDMGPEHLGVFPRMTGWFKPGLLLRLLLNVVVSGMFGQYADRRLIHAALDKQTPDERRKWTDVSTDDPGRDVWVDYVADLGDGFDATYAIAHVDCRVRLPIRKGEKLGVIPITFAIDGLGLGTSSAGGAQREERRAILSVTF